jgi:hypothetical protein
LLHEHRVERIDVADVGDAQNVRLRGAVLTSFVSGPRVPNAEDVEGDEPANEN